MTPEEVIARLGSAGVAPPKRRYTGRPRGCGGIGRRARFRSVWGKPRGGSSPLIRIGISCGLSAHSVRKASPLLPVLPQPDLRLLGAVGRVAQRFGRTVMPTTGGLGVTA